MRVKLFSSRRSALALQLALFVSIELQVDEGAADLENRGGYFTLCIEQVDGPL